MSGNEIKVADMICPEALMKEVATFSLARRNLAFFAALPAFIVIIIPTTEEFIFRYLLQETFLKKKILKFLEFKNPEVAEFWNSKKGACIRVVMSTLAFALAHKKPLKIIPLSFAASVLQEKYGIVAATSLHCTNNFCSYIELIPFFRRCYLPS